MQPIRIGDREVHGVSPDPLGVRFGSSSRTPPDRWIAVPGPHRGPWTPSGSPPNGSGDIGVASVSRERGAGGCREVVSKPGRNESRRRRLSWRAVQAAHPTGHRRQPAGGSAQMRRPVGDRVRVHQPGGQACTPYAPPALGPRVQDPVPILVTGQGERPGSSAAGRREGARGTGPMNRIRRGRRSSPIHGAYPTPNHHRTNPPPRKRHQRRRLSTPALSPSPRRPRSLSAGHGGSGACVSRSEPWPCSRVTVASARASWPSRSPR